MNKSIKISGLLSALLLAWGGAHAAGLGKLSVQSALGQPLRAEIELVSVTKDDLPGISARLASDELFRQARIDRSGSLGSLEFDVAQRANGQPVIRITSSTPMADPFLDMLIELNWSTGRIIREYTILLDPPTEDRAAPQTAVAKPAAPVTSAPSKDDATAETPKQSETVAKPTAKAAAKPAPTTYGPVKSGETLRSIAGRVKNPDVTLEQMMAGLYLTNKSAFIEKNMNLLKRGAVLNVPTSEAVHLQTSPSQAVRMIQNHVEAWHAYRGKVAEVAGEVPQTETEGQAAAGKITPKVADRATPSTAPRDVLKLSRGEPAAGGKPDAKTQERLQNLEEELAAKSRALQESQDRVSQLERAVRDMQQLLEMKSREAAKPAPAAPAASESAQPAAPRAAPAPAPVAKPAPAAVPPVPPASAQEEASWFSTFLKNPIYIGGLVAAALLSGLLWMMMMGNRRRQGLNKFEDSIMTGGEFKSGAVFNTAGMGAAASPANTEGSMLLTDFSRLGLGTIDTHEVDPIAEAEVYMAYGRNAQAEEILKDALEKDASRHEIALKLLEIYAARKDPLAFETTASELYAGLGGQDTPVWQRAAEMGRSIDPDNPLYRMAQGQSFAASSEASPTASVEEAVAGERDTPASAADDLALDFSSSLAPSSVSETAEAAHDLDFTSSFGMPESETTPAAPAAPEVPAMEDMSTDFEPMVAETEPDLAEQSAEREAVLEMPEELAEFHAVEAPQAEEAPEMGEVIELELPSVEGAEEAVAEPMPELDLSGIDLDLDMEAPREVAPEEVTPHVVEEVPAAPDLETALELPAAPVEAPADEVATAPAAGIDPALWEEVNTKLDLARAYLEMGDREGAREILQEVTQEGDDSQKAQANELLSEAG